MHEEKTLSFNALVSFHSSNLLLHSLNHLLPQLVALLLLLLQQVLATSSSSIFSYRQHYSWLYEPYVLALWPSSFSYRQHYSWLFGPFISSSPVPLH